MINPVLTNTKIHFSDDLFPEEFIKKYNDFLFHKNYPLKNIGAVIYESIQNIEIAGINLNPLIVQSINNTRGSSLNKSSNGFPHTTINRGYPGTDPINNIIDNQVLTITMRNNLLNWMYFYEVCHGYYKRTRNIDLFDIIITALDSAEIPMINFRLKNCFVQTLPGLSFSFNSAFNETKTIDVGIFFNEFNVEFLIPSFNLEKINF
jgi:hypothetical protein